MKTLSSCLIILIIFSFPACSKKTTVLKETPVASTTIELPVKMDSTTKVNYRFIVTFYSIGSGTEHDQINRLEKFITDYSLKSGASIAYEKSIWGREGEINYCMQLSEISIADQQKFMASIKEELKSAKWVRFSENTPCGGRRIK